jgi:hypothetical protein
MSPLRVLTVARTVPVSPSQKYLTVDPHNLGSTVKKMTPVGKLSKFSGVEFFELGLGAGSDACSSVTPRAIADQRF